MIIERNNGKVIEYEILKHIGTIAESTEDNTTYRKEINIISYNGNEPVFDIRPWIVVTGEKTTRKRVKGITLNKNELKAVYSKLRERFAQGDELTGGIKIKGMTFTVDETRNMYEILVEEVCRQ